MSLPFPLRYESRDEEITDLHRIIREKYHRIEIIKKNGGDPKSPMPLDQELEQNKIWIRDHQKRLEFLECGVSTGLRLDEISLEGI